MDQLGYGQTLGLASADSATWTTVAIVFSFFGKAEGNVVFTLKVEVVHILGG